jgi:hypothetical protein
MRNKRLGPASDRGTSSEPASPARRRAEEELRAAARRSQVVIRRERRKMVAKGLLGFVFFFLGLTIGLLSGVLKHSHTPNKAELAGGIVLILIGVVLIFRNRQSRRQGIPYAAATLNKIRAVEASIVNARSAEENRLITDGMRELEQGKIKLEQERISRPLRRRRGWLGGMTKTDARAKAFDQWMDKSLHDEVRPDSPMPGPAEPPGW